MASIRMARARRFMKILRRRADGHPGSQIDLRGNNGNGSIKNGGSGWGFLQISHADQGSLGKWYVKQRSADGEGCAQSYFLHQEKRGHGPQFVEGENEGKYLAEFFAEALVVES